MEIFRSIKTPSECSNAKTFQAVLSVFRKSVDAFLCFGTEVFHRVPPKSHRFSALPNQLRAICADHFHYMDDRCVDTLGHAEILSDLAFASLSRRAAIVRFTSQWRIHTAKKQHESTIQWTVSERSLESWRISTDQMRSAWEFSLNLSRMHRELSAIFSVRFILVH